MPEESGPGVSRILRGSIHQRRAFYEFEIEIHLIQRLAVQAAVWAGGVVERPEKFQSGPGLAYRFVGVQIHLVVFDRAPQALDEHVVAPAAFAVHASGGCRAV